jgi:hypothetical protein
MLEEAENQATKASSQFNEAKAETLNKVEELQKMNTFMVGREVKMSELKAEVNLLLKELGRPNKYSRTS